MPDLDEYLRNELRRTVRPVDVNDVSSRIDVRRTRRARARKVQAAALTMVVLAGTVGGVAVLSVVFRQPGQRIGSAPEVGNGVIVYSDIRNAGEHLWVVNPDGAGPRELTTGGGVSDSGAAVSPDGRTVAFVRTDGNGSSVYTIGIDGSGLARITSPSWSAIDPTWSPDGIQIAFVAHAGDGHGLYVMAATLDGAAPHKIAGGKDLVPSDPTWSPDGSTLAFSASSSRAGDAATGTYDLWTVEATGVRATNITATPDTSEAWPSWSPDGERILFVRGSTSSDHAGNTLMIVAPHPDATPIALTDGSPIDQNPAWSPDGRSIVFDRSTASETDVYTMRPDGMDATLVARNATDPAWQPVPPELGLPPASSPASTDNSVDLGLGFPVCNVETLRDDFNDDGIVDTAWTATKAPDVGPCPTFDGSFTVVAVDVTGDGLADGSAGPLEHCLLCHPFAATDLDGDGARELVVVEQSASVTEYALFSIHPERAETGQALQPITVAPPGDPGAGFRAGEPFTFWAGGDEGYASYVRCADGPSDLLVTQTSHPVEGPGSDVRRIRYDELRLADDRIQVIGRNDSTEPTSTPFEGWTGPACGVDFYP